MGIFGVNTSAGIKLGPLDDDGKTPRKIRSGPLKGKYLPVLFLGASLTGGISTCSGLSGATVAASGRVPGQNQVIALSEGGHLGAAVGMSPIKVMRGGQEVSITINTNGITWLGGVACPHVAEVDDPSGQDGSLSEIDVDKRNRGIDPTTAVGIAALKIVKYVSGITFATSGVALADCRVMPGGVPDQTPVAQVQTQAA